jgi:tol-pal system protein YbgF
VKSRLALLCAAALAVSGLGGCASTPPDQDPVQLKLNDLDTRLARIERVVANQSLLDLANQIEQLRTDVRGMHNDVDVLNHNLDAARKQQRDLYADLDQRLKALEQKAGTFVPSSVGLSRPAGGASGQTADGADKASYQAAFDLLKDGHYDQAIAAFKDFATDYPGSTLLDNAQYWLGEAYYVNKAFPDALAAFQRVVQDYPSSRKVPDALLKVGFCDDELKQYAAARDALNQVLTQYPDSAAAPFAKERLAKMAAEQH